MTRACPKVKLLMIHMYANTHSQRQTLVGTYTHLVTRKKTHLLAQGHCTFCIVRPFSHSLPTSYLPLSLLLTHTHRHTYTYKHTHTQTVYRALFSFIRTNHFTIKENWKQTERDTEDKRESAMSDLKVGLDCLTDSNMLSDLKEHDL